MIAFIFNIFLFRIFVEDAHLVLVEEVLEVSKELIQGSLLNIHTKVLHKLLEHGVHVLVHLHQDVHLVLCCGVKSLRKCQGNSSKCKERNSKAKRVNE